jgi:hypothetical protein
MQVKIPTKKKFAHWVDQQLTSKPIGSGSGYKNLTGSIDIIPLNPNRIQNPIHFDNPKPYTQ